MKTAEQPVFTTKDTKGHEGNSHSHKKAQKQPVFTTKGNPRSTKIALRQAVWTALKAKNSRTAIKRKDR